MEIYVGGRNEAGEGERVLGGCAILNGLLRESLVETFESKLKVRIRKPTSCLGGTREEGVPADGTVSMKAKGGSRPGRF